MPYEWTQHPSRPAAVASVGAAPLAHLRLWPHRSLPRRGMAWFVGVTAGMLALPLLVMLGTPVLWALLPFIAAVLAGLWLALQRNYRDGTVCEDLRLWPGLVRIDRQDPRRPTRVWQANPHWVRLTLHAQGGPVENYLTLHGAGRQVELGAFLSPEERQDLFADLQTRLQAAH